MFFLILCVIVAGCISNNGNSEENAFVPDNFLKLTVLSENNTTLTMVFDEDLTSGFHWKLTMGPDDVLKIIADEKMPADDLPQEIEKHKWMFEGNKTGTTELKFEYINQLKNDTPERYAYTIRNTNGNLEILSFSSFSGNRTRHNPYAENAPYSEKIGFTENNTILFFSGQSMSSSGGGANDWELEHNLNYILIVNKTETHNLTDPSDGRYWWEIEGKKAGNTTLSFNYVNSELGLISEIVCEIQINENKEMAILNISYNSIKSDPMPYHAAGKY